MAGNPKQKLKLLYIYDILLKKSDEENPLSAIDICKCLEEHDITAERKSIYSDIEALRDFGVDIMKTKVPKSGFYIGNRDFEVAEIRMLADAVQASGFIPAKKSNELSEKLYDLLSEGQSDFIRNQIYVNRGIKCENNEIYYNIDKIQTAINSGNKIRFKYYRREIVNNKPVYDKGKEFEYSPYAMMWSDDRYYLVGNYEKYDNLSHYRIDRMKKVEIIESKARPFSEVSDYTRFFDIGDYAKKVFKMFGGGEEKTIELICKNYMLEPIIDRFGTGVPYRIADEEHFKIIVKGEVTDGLLSWLMDVGGSVRVVSPPDLVEKAQNKVKQIAKDYGLTVTEVE